MNNITNITTINAGRPDDLFIVSASFEEERCLEGAKRLVDYSAKCTIVIDFESTSNPHGEAKKRRTAGVLMHSLRRVDLGGVPRHLSISGYDPVGLVRELKGELRGRGLELKDLSVTIDISCLTKIQLVAIMKFLAGPKIAQRLRMIYSYPKSYNTSGWDRHSKLYSGFAKPIVFPVQGAVIQPNLIEERLAIVLIGHEGERSLAAWRSVEPDQTWIVEGTSSDRSVMEACRIENLFLYDLVERKKGDNARFTFRSLDYDGARRQLARSLQSLDSPKTQVVVIPFGPKPLLVALVAAAFETRDLVVQLAYPAATSYNSQYSSGVASVCSFEIK